MKVIDLLNKIANNEEVPKKIKYEDDIFEYQEYCKDYQCISNKELGFLLKDDVGYYYCYKRLNDEIEIIEEKPKKIKEFEMMYPISNEFDSEIGCLVSIYNSNLAHIKQGIDELTKAVNYLLEKESDK